MHTSSNPNPPDVSTYVALYATATTHRERAEIERAVIDEYCAAKVHVQGYHAPADALGANRDEVVQRLAMLKKLTALQWDQVETIGRVGVAYRIFSKLGADGLQRYAHGSDEERAGIRAEVWSGDGTKPKNNKTEHHKPKASPWADLRSTVLAQILAADHPLRARFDRDLAALFATWGEELRMDRRRGTAAVELPELPKPISSRKRVVDACRVLAMDPPKPNQPVDLSQARRAQRRLARLYHPDANGGDSSKLEAFHAVNDAFRLLETYNQTTLGEQSNVEEKPE